MRVPEAVKPLVRVVDRRSPMIGSSLYWRYAALRGGVPQHVVDRLVRPGAVVADIGASGGLFTTALRRRVGRTGAVHAFEPNSCHLERLGRISAAHSNVHLHPVALSDRTGSAEFMVPVVDGERYEGMGSLEDPRAKLDADADSTTVPTARLDDELEGIDVDFVKCDVEGHEDQVFDGAERILAGQPIILVEIEQRHRNSDPGLLIDRLVGAGLRGWAVFDDGLRPVEEFDLERDQLRFVPGARGPEMPRGYVHDFLFTPSHIDVSPFQAS